MADPFSALANAITARSELEAVLNNIAQRRGLRVPHEQCQDCAAKIAVGETFCKRCEAKQ